MKAIVVAVLIQSQKQLQQAKAGQLQSIQKQDLEFGSLWEQACSQKVKVEGQDIVIELCKNRRWFGMEPWCMRKDLLLWVNGSTDRDQRQVGKNGVVAQMEKGPEETS